MRIVEHIEPSMGSRGLPMVDDFVVWLMEQFALNVLDEVRSKSLLDDFKTDILQLDALRRKTADVLLKGYDEEQGPGDFVATPPSHLHMKKVLRLCGMKKTAPTSHARLQRLLRQPDVAQSLNIPICVGFEDAFQDFVANIGYSKRFQWLAQCADERRVDQKIEGDDTMVIALYSARLMLQEASEDLIDWEWEPTSFVGDAIARLGADFPLVLDQLPASGKILAFSEVLKRELSFTSDIGALYEMLGGDLFELILARKNNIEDAERLLSRLVGRYVEKLDPAEARYAPRCLIRKHILTSRPPLTVHSGR
jgi:hypothetical protein